MNASSTGSEYDNNTTVGAISGADGDDDDDASVSVGTPRIYVSPDQFDGKDDIRRRVGWQAVDNTLSNNGNIADNPVKEDAAGKTQRQAIAVLEPPRFGGGSNRDKDDLGGGDRWLILKTYFPKIIVIYNLKFVF